MLRPSHEEVLSIPRRALALATVAAVLLVACAVPRAPAPAAPLAPPAPARHLPPLDDPAARAHFECAAEVQRAQGFDPGGSLTRGSLVGMLVGGFIGGGLGALFGLIGDVPGPSAALGAIAGGGTGAMVGGQLALRADTAAYVRGLEACLAARAAGTRAAPPPAAGPGLVEYRLRLLSLRHEAFTSYLSTAELADGATGRGLMQLAAAADAGALPRGVVLYDRHLVPASEPVARAFGATAVDARVRLGGVGRDDWDEARWLGRPGERTVWLVIPRARRDQEVRRVGLSDVAALAQFRPVSPPLLGAVPGASVAVPLPYVRHAEERGTAGTLVDRSLDRARGIAALVAVNEDRAFPDRVYLVVTHAAQDATYEAVLAWSPRAGEGRDLPRE